MFTVSFVIEMYTRPPIGIKKFHQNREGSRKNIEKAVVSCPQGLVFLLVVTSYREKTSMLLNTVQLFGYRHTIWDDLTNGNGHDVWTGNISCRYTSYSATG